MRNTLERAIRRVAPLWRLINAPITVTLVLVVSDHWY